MRERIGSTSWLAVGALLLGAAATQAGDTIKLSLPASKDVPALKLGEIGLDADTIDAGYRGHGGHYHGGYHGGYRGGYHGGYHVGHYGGYRGYYGGYRGYYGGYRGFYGGYRGYYGAYYRPYFYGAGYYGYSPYYYSSSYYYTSPSVYYYSSPIYCPIGMETTTTLESQRVMPPADALNYAPQTQTLPLPRDAGTYPYDGGPRAPVPMPRIDNPGDAPPARLSPIPTVPLDGRPVSLPAPKATPVKYTFPAYGELSRSK